MSCLISVSYVCTFPDGEKIVTLSKPNGGGGNSYHIMVGSRYWGTVSKNMYGWHARLQVPNQDYTAGCLQPLIDIVTFFNS